MKKSSHTSNVDWELLAKFLSDEANETEKNMVSVWAEESGTNNAELNASKELMEEARHCFNTQDIDAAKGWSKISPAILEPEKAGAAKPKINNTPVLPALLRIAAVALLILTLGTAGYLIGSRQNQPAVFTEVVSNHQQVISGIILPDGTEVALNSNSVLSFPKEFRGKTREVTLTGEAYFKVKPNEKSRFVLTAGDARVMVLGTSFNVSAYPDNEWVEVTVETGKVELSCPHYLPQSSNKLVLTPGEKGSVADNGLSVIKTTNNDKNVLAWMTRRFIFEETPLSEVISLLEKNYYTHIQISDPGLANLRLTATFSDQPIEFILEVISLTFNLEIKSLNGQYFLTSFKDNK